MHDNVIELFRPSQMRRASLRPFPSHISDCCCSVFFFFFCFFIFSFDSCRFPSTGNSHVQQTVNEKKKIISTFTLKCMHGHLHTQAYMHTVKTKSHYYT